MTGDFSTAKASLGQGQVTARGYLGGREYELREATLVRRGERVDFGLGRQYVAEADQLKLDGARLAILHACALLTLLATLLIPLVAGAPWLAAAVAFVWGGAGGSLYTLAMIDIGSREDGITLVNSTAVLVLSYTLGGVLAPALGAAMLQWAPVVGFPALLLAVAGPGWWLLRRAQLRG